MRTAAVLLPFALAGLAGCGKLTPLLDPTAADKGRLRGVWVVERLDAGRPADAVDAGTLQSRLEQGGAWLGRSW